MAMQPKLWNANELSTELGVTYRTAHARLANVKPAEIRGNRRLYRLTDAVPAILGYRSNGGHAPVESVDSIAARAGGPFSVTRSPVDEAVCVVLTMLASRLPAEVAVAAVRAGASAELANEIFKAVAIRTCAIADELVEELGIVWASPSHFDLPPVPDWDALVSPNSA
jgi:hypothetical protein